MSDRNNLRSAKAGDPISGRARKRMLAAFPRAIVPHTNLSEKVESKTDEKRGQWVCITCGEFFQNNIQTWSHGYSKPKHVFAWHAGAGRIEEP